MKVDWNVSIESEVKRKMQLYLLKERGGEKFSSWLERQLEKIIAQWEKELKEVEEKKAKDVLAFIDYPTSPPNAGSYVCTACGAKYSDSLEICPQCKRGRV